MTNNEKMTVKEAFIAAYYYLLEHYKRTENPEDGSSLEIGDLLSDMLFLEDGGTADPAAWHDWMIAVKRAKEDTESIKCRLVEPES